MDRLQLLERVLAAIAVQDVAAARAYVAAAAPEEDPVVAVLGAFAAFWSGEHERAVETLATSQPEDGDAVALHTVVRGLVAAAVGGASLGDPFGEILEIVGPYDTANRWGAFIRYAAVEGAMADARLSLAAQLMPEGSPSYVAWEGHPYAGVMVACRARLDAFSGRIDDAAAALAGAPRDGVAGTLLHATEALIAGNAADPEVVERCAQLIEDAEPGVLDHLGRPDVLDGPPYEQAASLFRLAALPNIYLKLTPRIFGDVKKDKASAETFFPRVAEAFGARRMAWGSNYPTSPGTLQEILATAQAGLACLSEEDRAWIFGKTAQRLYPALA